MPPQEWAHRARTAALVARDRLRPAHPADVPTPQPGWPRPAGAPALVTDEDVARVSALPGAVDAARVRADRLVEGRVSFFGHGEIRLPEELDWNLDLATGHRYPATHWSRVEYRTGGDPKWLWELGRHIHVVHLARAWRLTGDDRYADTAARHLRGFLDQAPRDTGIHWRVGLELGLRMISWAWIVEFLRGSHVCTPELGRDLLASADGQMAWLERYPSLYSSANNHRLGELAGLVVGGLAFPELPRAEERHRAGVEGLGAELAAQTHPDGVNAEAAVYYHAFVLDLCTAAVSVMVRGGRAVPESVARPVLAMADVTGTLCSDRMTLPAIGDNDDAVAVELMSSTDEAERLRSRFRTVSALLGTATARRDGGIDEQTIWLCGDRAVEATPHLPGSAVFPAGGLAVLRRRDDRGEVRAVLRAGPFGLGPIYAHAHADQLSLCLSVAGEEAIVDAGTFTYYGEQRWRDFARSTAAHSTVRIDDRDQVTPSGRFLWREHVDGVIDLVDLDPSAPRVRAHHAGYAPVRHEREVRLTAEGLVVVDRLSGDTDPHQVEVHWNLAPGEAEIMDDTVRWNGERGSLDVRVEGLGPVRVVTGCASRPLGFRSTGLEVWEPSPTVVARARVTLPATVTTRVTVRWR